MCACSHEQGRRLPQLSSQALMKDQLTAHTYIYSIGAGEDLREYIKSRYPIDLFSIIKLYFGSCP